MEHQFLVPDYYEKFACKGSACRHNCCQDWEISFSKADYLKIRNAKKSPDMEAAVKAAVKRNRENGSDSRYASFFDAKTGLCAMQDADGLCRLQAECGYQTLPAVCQEFPRNKVLAPVPEQSCFIGCERVVELLMESSEPLSFHYRAAEHGELPPGLSAVTAAGIVKRPIYQYFSEIQALCIDILQNRAYPLDDRMILLGIALKRLHELEVAGKVDELPQWLLETQQFAVGDDWKDSLAALPGDSLCCAANNAHTLLRFSVSENSKFAQLQATVLQAFEISYSGETDGDTISGNLRYSTAAYQAATARFAGLGYDEALENILVNAVFHCAFPFFKKEIWDSYLFLCFFYSLLQFTLAGAITPASSKADFAEMVAVLSREIWHSTTLQPGEELASSDSDTLAHMVILLRG